MAAMMSYRRLRPDLANDTDEPIMGSYLADLDALLSGSLLSNSGAVTERMVCALIRNLRLKEEYEDLNTFLETILDRKHPPLQIFDGFSDAYVHLRMEGLLHDPAMTKLAGVRLPELREQGDHKIDAAQPDALPIQKLRIRDTPGYDFRIVSLTVLT